ncbi:MAG: type 1 glutamine amidotransferase [Rhodobacteraceae bacterium]|nr:type 1 glutamine amidotransferase [Paracoccaceae bacterium]
MRVAVVENTARTPHGLVGAALREAGATVTVFRPFAEDGLPTDLAEHDALIVLGGAQSAVDDARHPYLPALARLMRDYCEAGKAVLGICLGAQLLARGYGAKNIVGAATEFGWHGVELTEDGRSDAVLSAFGTEKFDAFQWHDDTFTLPEGAVHLGRNATARNQAFRIGRAGYGTQFHFEAGSAVVRTWTEQFAEQTEEKHPGWVAAHEEIIARHGPSADALGLALARAWIGLIRPASG